MATKFTPKKNKVTGTKSSDKITWANSRLWKKTLTVNAGAGNDVINFKKSNYAKNKLNGQTGNDTIYGGKKADIIDGGAGSDKLFGYAGNDTIKGGTGNDQLTGGKGNDVIQTGKGANTVFISKGDGNDTIYHQGTKTIVQIKGAKASDKQEYTKSGNNLILKYTHAGTKTSETITYKNYFTLKNKNIVLKVNSTKTLDTILKSKGVKIVGSGNITATNYKDTICLGAGNNTIKFNKNGGKDTVLKGKGVDTLVFASETASTLSAKFSGNDVIITAKNGKNTVTLKDYGKGDHSAQWVTIGKNTVRIDSLLPKNIITAPNSGNDYIGTSRPDNIIVRDYGYNPVIVKANAGDDNIVIDAGYVIKPPVGTGNGNIVIDAGYVNKPPVTVDTGTGNDTVNITGGANVSLLLKAGTGSDTVTGLGFCGYGGSGGYGGSSGYGGSGGYNGPKNTLFLDMSNGSELIMRAFGNRPYILGEIKDDDLIIKLTSGETITIKGFNLLTDEEKYKTLLIGENWGQSSGYSDSLIDCLHLDPIIELDKNNRSIDRSASDVSVWVTAKDDADYTVKTGNGNKNLISIEKNGNNNITVGNGNNNYVAIQKFSLSTLNSTPVRGNQTVKVGNGNGNEIAIYTNNNSTVTVGNGLGNKIYSYAQNKNTITTGSGQNTINIGYNDGTNVSNDTIHSYGNDQILEFNGNTQITFEGDGSNKGKTILARVDVSSGASKIQAVVNNVENAQTANLVVAPKVSALMPYYSLYDNNNDGIYDVVYSAINMSNGKDGDREIVVKNAYKNGNYATSMTAPTYAKLCDMERAGINSFDYSDNSSIYSDCLAVIDGKGNDTINMAGDKIVSLNSGLNILTVNNVGDDEGIVFVNGGNNIINNKGKASIRVNGGLNRINLSGEDIDKKIYMASGTDAIVNGVFDLCDGLTVFTFYNADGQTIESSAVMTYLANGSNSLSLVTRHHDSTVQLKNVMPSILEDSAYLSNVRVSDGHDEIDVNSLWSYYDMVHENTHEFYRTEYYDKQGEGIDTAFFVDGTEADDRYLKYSVKEYGKDIICDYGGNDSLQIGYSSTYGDSYQTDFDTFFHVYKNEAGAWTVDDLFFINDIKNMQTDAPSTGNWFDSGDAEYIQIKDYFGEGKIENIVDYNGAKLDNNKLNQIKQNVIAWLESNHYNSTLDAINSFNHNNADDWTSFKQLYHEQGQNYSAAWTNNMYQL